ncbi:hypothetical protein HD554DRAFT_2223615 [Boletus coccyginus]|nr:hypothetical protein HD554DRAFT_2223615 [Boletus coccyginus]
MNGRWLGAMPVDAFLDKFVPATKKKLPALPKNPFKKVPSDGVESTRYRPFVSTHSIAAIKRWMPHLQAVDTSTKEDTVNNLKLKTDISIYDRVKGVAPPTRTDFSRMELWMEFKTKTDGVAFQDPRDITDESRLVAMEEGSFTPATAEGIMARGQLAHYAGAQHSMQFRHFSFSVVIHGDHARFLRWDPSGTVVTSAFNYRTDPKLMAEFLWRFDHLSARDRGHDQSIQPANLSPEAGARAREKLGINDKSVPLFKYEVPGLTGMGDAYGPRPPTQNRSLVSRCTRSLPVVWIPTEDVNGGPSSCSERDADPRTGQEKGPWSEERTIYMKDTWRFLPDSPDVEVMPEHEIYAILHRHGTPNIPEHVAGGDVNGGRTTTQEFVGAPWLCVRPRISPYQHYRLVHGIVGRALFKFECTKQLVTAVFDALEAHSHAYHVAKILHRDISAGNIILTDDGKGLLIDWELAKMMDEGGSRRPDRTGTWQFMSANLLWHPGKVHMLTDDLESFLHVLGWMTLRYVPASHTYLAFHRGIDMAMFDEHYQQQGNSEQGGHQKSQALRAGNYPSSTFQPRQETPLVGLLQELREPFKSLYGKPPTDEDRERVNVPFNRSDRKLIQLFAAIDQFDQDMECLESSTWFVDTMRTALDEQIWPTDDTADEELPIAYDDDTERQAQQKISQHKNAHSVWERSKGLSRGSKRAASPTPERSAKRSRSTPTASGTQN